MSEDFGYVNARIRGLSSRLLEPEFFQSALANGDFDAFTSALAQSGYAEDLEEGRAVATGLPAVDRAVARNFQRTTRSILSFSDGEPHELIAILLRRYDLDDLKTVARAQHAGRPPEELGEALLGVGELTPSLLERLAAAPDLPTAAQALGVTRHPLARAFTRAARQYAQDGDLLAFELSLDRAHFESLFDSANEAGAPDAFVRYLEREVDAANVRTALKLRGRSGDLERFYLPGGKEISRDAFLQLAGGRDLNVLNGTSFEEAAEAEDGSGVERAVRAALDRAARRIARRDPLGIGVAIRYLRRKEAEAARLRLLARGTYYRVPREQMEKELGDA